MSPGVCGGINQLLERDVDGNPVTQALRTVKPLIVLVGVRTSKGIVLSIKLFNYFLTKTNAGRGLQPRPKRLVFTVIQKFCVRYI